MAAKMLTSILVAAILGSAAATPLDQPADNHVIEKRQAIALDNILPRDFTSLFSGLNLTTVGIIIFLFLVADVIVTVALAAWLGVGGFGRARQDFGVSSFFGNFYNRIDVVESALNMMSLEEEVCRHKAVCMAERAAVNNPFAKLAINTINRNLSGLSRYREAVEAGLSGQDCHLIYDQCNRAISLF